MPGQQGFSSEFRPASCWHVIAQEQKAYDFLILPYYDLIVYLWINIDI